VIVYTGQELTRARRTRMKKYAETIIVKDGADARATARQTSSSASRGSRCKASDACSSSSTA